MSMQTNKQQVCSIQWQLMHINAPLVLIRYTESEHLTTIVIFASIFLFKLYFRIKANFFIIIQCGICSYNASLSELNVVQNVVLIWKFLMKSQWSRPAKLYGSFLHVLIMYKWFLIPRLENFMFCDFITKRLTAVCTNQQL